MKTLSTSVKATKKNTESDVLTSSIKHESETINEQMFKVGMYIFILFT